MEKTAPKDSEYWKNESILEIAKNGFLENSHFVSKIKNEKKSIFKRFL